MLDIMVDDLNGRTGKIDSGVKIDDDCDENK